LYRSGYLIFWTMYCWLWHCREHMSFQLSYISSPTSSNVLYPSSSRTPLPSVPYAPKAQSHPPTNCSNIKSVNYKCGGCGDVLCGISGCGCCSFRCREEGLCGLVGELPGSGREMNETFGLSCIGHRLASKLKTVVLLWDFESRLICILFVLVFLFIFHASVSICFLLLLVKQMVRWILTSERTLYTTSSPFCSLIQCMKYARKHFCM